MSIFLGLDSSTQSMSSMLIDVDSGKVLNTANVSFNADLPQYNCGNGVLANDNALVKHSDPCMWAAALDMVLQRLVDQGADLSRVRAISGSGQQHGTVYLKDTFLAAAKWPAAADLAAQVAPMLSRATSPIWMDSSTSLECREITAAAGGAGEVQERSGSPAIERFSAAQIRRFAKNDAAAYAETAVIHLVSSFLASLLAGKSVGIDIGDGAGMNLMNLATNAWDPLLVQATAPDLARRLPPLVSSDSVVAVISDYFVQRYGFSAGTAIIAWSGDNPNSLIGVGAWAAGTAVISLGTSDTFFAAMSEPCVDPNGYGHVFGNPAGGYMSLICFKNGSLAREEIAKRYGLTMPQFDKTIAATPVGNNGNMMLPYFVPEITPLVLAAKPVCIGSEAFVSGDDAAASVRAVVEAQALRMRLHSQWINEDTRTLRVTGGASVSNEICQTLADVFNARVERMQVANSAALGAALRAAHGVGAADWHSLTQSFCKPQAGKDLAPLAANVQLYEQMLPRFAQLVDDYQKEFDG